MINLVMITFSLGSRQISIYNLQAGIVFSIRSLSALRLDAYVNHSTGLVPVIHCRKLGVPYLL